MTAKKQFFHISDLHYVSGHAESYGQVLSEMLSDIEKKFPRGEDRYLIFSGDIVKQGSDQSSYREFLDLYSTRFADLGFTKDKTICIPGNHDVCRDHLTKKLIEHEGVIRECSDETVFCHHIRGKELFKKKFLNYMEFEGKFAAFGVGNDVLGRGHALSENLGVYCLNSAYFSSAGLMGLRGPTIDKGKLVVDTRGLHEWMQNTNFENRILVMHHPLDWLADWSANELKPLLGKSISLLLTGHTHEQDSYTRRDTSGIHAHCMAPALFTSKDDLLGYAVISFSEDNFQQVEYRQWIPKSRQFVAGTALSSTDDGIFRFEPKNKYVEPASASSKSLMTFGRTEVADYSSLAVNLKTRLDSALAYFSGQPNIFVEPVLSDYSEVAGKRGDNSKPIYGVEGILSKGFPAVIHAPPQFGLTCLARHFCCVAWSSHQKLWIYIDAAETKPHRRAVVEAVQSELEDLKVTMAEVYGVIIDSVRGGEKESNKLVHKIAEAYPGLDTLVMRSSSTEGDGDLSEIGGKEVNESFLWSISRTSIRKIVSEYNDIRLLGDEDLITSRLAMDLEMMNIHRTPLNCFTLLKASEKQHEESPVNRAELISRVLYVLFNSDDIPTYKSRPDVKDCEFVLGYLCELIIKKENPRFLREQFKTHLVGFCSENLLDIDVDWVFDVLYRNNIIISRGHWFEFRFSYWVMYFAAQRMCQSTEFKGFIFQGQRYSNYPEIIEFYTGINRSMRDAVEVLTEDLRNAIYEFDSKIALPDDFDIFSSAQWQPSTPALEQMRNETTKGVEVSNLPESVKDQYADRSYDSRRPYGQDIKLALEGFSYNKMLQAMRASAKALRNSDYVDTDSKRKLLAEIITVWERAATVILVLVPALAKNGEAAFDDVRYVLSGNFPTELKERFLAVLQEIPVNIAGYYQHDLFSHKMGPLLLRELSNGGSNMARHLISLVLVDHRPKGWAFAIKEYVTSLPRNSFYLFDVYSSMRTQYRYGYASPAALSELEHLIKACAAKHVTGAKDLGKKKVEQIAAGISYGEEGVIPKRRIGPDGEILVDDEGADDEEAGDDEKNIH